MKTFLLSIGSALKSLQATLFGLGALGILAIGFIDAASIPLPGGPDVVVMALSHANHSMMPLYVLAAVVGSTAGSLVLYFAARKGGEAVLRKFSPEKRARVEDLLDRYDILAMLLASVLPPPFPFKLFVLSAGAFKMQLWRFVAALVAVHVQQVARRLVICGMHVHVGIEDEDLRIDLLGQAAYFLPHLLALSTSSPFSSMVATKAISRS